MKRNGRVPGRTGVAATRNQDFPLRLVCTFSGSLWHPDTATSCFLGYSPNPLKRVLNLCGVMGFFENLMWDIEPPFGLVNTLMCVYTLWFVDLVHWPGPFLSCKISYRKSLPASMRQKIRYKVDVAWSLSTRERGSIAEVRQQSHQEGILTLQQSVSVGRAVKSHPSPSVHPHKSVSKSITLLFTTRNFKTQLTAWRVQQQVTISFYKEMNDLSLQSSDPSGICR